MHISSRFILYSKIVRLEKSLLYDNNRAALGECNKSSESTRSLRVVANRLHNFSWIIYNCKFVQRPFWILEGFQQLFCCSSILNSANLFCWTTLVLVRLSQFPYVRNSEVDYISWLFKIAATAQRTAILTRLEYPSSWAYHQHCLLLICRDLQHHKLWLPVAQSCY